MLLKCIYQYGLNIRVCERAYWASRALHRPAENCSLWSQGKNYAAAGHSPRLYGAIRGPTIAKHKRACLRFLGERLLYIRILFFVSCTYWTELNTKREIIVTACETVITERWRLFWTRQWWVTYKKTLVLPYIFFFHLYSDFASKNSPSFPPQANIRVKNKQN